MKPSIAVLAACAICCGSANARPHRAAHRAKHHARLRPFPVARRWPAAPGNARLPLRDVVLFSSGVGYFGRAGYIRDKASIPLQFRVENINDILKSLVLFDASGGVRSVTYGSQDSLARRLGLADFRVDSSSSLGAILRQFQGAQVAVQVNGKTIYGRILSVSVQVVADKNGATRQIEILNLATASGLRAIPIANLGGIKLLDPSLDARLQAGLKLMATSFDESRRTVHLNFAGRGVRSVRVGYLLEAPVWKTSYRLILDGAQPYLQGWALVENTGDEDWNNVRLSLVSGRPISFVQDLYSPLYVSRAVVAPQVFGSPNSQLYGEAVDETAAPPRATLAPSLLNRSGTANFGNVGPAGPQRQAGGFGGGGFSNNGIVEDAAGPKADLEAVYGKYIPRRQDIAASALSGVAAQAAGSTRGELFEYALSHPVTIRRQSAAMVPIVSRRIAGEKISIYDANSSAQNALSGVRLTNTSGMQLAGGPITVFQNGIYAGDAQINTVGRGEHRYISYAVDLDLVATREEPTYRSFLTKVSAKSGVLTVTSRQQREVLYTFRNKSRAAKTILVVQKIEADFKPVASQKVSEKTADELRFRVWAPPGVTTKFKVTTERPLVETIALVNADFNFLVNTAVRSELSPALRASLQTLVEKRRRITDLDAKIARLEAQVNDISNDQARIRQNMDRLNQDSDLRKRYVQKLSDQETQLEKLNEELALARDDRAAGQKDLQAYLDNLTLE